MEWSRRVHTGTEAAQAIHDAFELFRYGRPRPVHIEVPLNVLEGPSDCPADLLEPKPSREPAGASAQAICNAAQLLAESRRPVLLAGGGSLRAGNRLLQFAEALDAPVVTTLNGKGAVPESHPLALGSDIRLPAAQQLCEEADVLLVIGSKVGEAELWFNQLHPSGTVIRVDILPGQMAKNVAADVPLVGDSAAVVRQLLAALRENNDGGAPPFSVVDQASLLLPASAWRPESVETAAPTAWPGCVRCCARPRASWPRRWPRSPNRWPPCCRPTPSSAATPRR